MHEHPDADASPDADAGDDDLVVVAVVRSGGLAGLRRTWSVERPAAQAEHWIMLIDSCPWDAPAVVEPGADRYVWTVLARTPAEERQRELGESELDGPWRDLVDAVRTAEEADDGRGGGPPFSAGA